jgi:YVTN family beta-propeller protein
MGMRNLIKGGYIVVLICLAVLFVTVSSFVFVSALTSDGGSPLSPTAFVIDIPNNQIIIAQKTGLRIDFIDYTSGQLLYTLPTRLPPTGVCLSTDGKAYVTCSYSTSEVLVIDVSSKKVIERISAGHGAISPIPSPVTNTLYVANQFDDDISVIDLTTHREIARIDVLRQPMTMDISPDGRWLFVANLLPATRADIDTVAADVTIIDLMNNEAVKHLKLPSGSNALRGIRVSPDGRHVFVSHNLGRFQVPTSQLEQGWMNTSALSILDIEQQELKASILLDEHGRGAAGSWGVDVNDKVVVVAHAGTHDYSIIGYPEMIAKLRQTKDPDALSYDLTFLSGIRNRYPVQGEGPRAIKLEGNRVITALYFSDALQVIDLGSGQTDAMVKLNPGLQIDSVRMGEMAFNDARLCFQQWQGCSGCHPNDARIDGLNWDLLNDGIGNPKNCKSMLLAHETPPSMITGIRPSAEFAVRAGFRHIQFADIDESKARTVDLYLQSLKPVPSPLLVHGALSGKALKGKEIFDREGCGHCHSGPYFTDRKTHAIGTPGPTDRTNKWDTPTLIEVWRTAPYLHDGRNARMQEVFMDEQHGLKEKLGEQELNHLVEYVMSL